MAAHGMRAEKRVVESASDLNRLIGEVVQSLLSNPRTPSHPRIVVVVDLRMMEVAGYAVNPIYSAPAEHPPYFAGTALHCVYQTANYLMPMHRKPTQNWQKKGTVELGSRFGDTEDPAVPVSLVLSRNLLLWAENVNANGNVFEAAQWIRLDKETEIEKDGVNAFAVDDELTAFICPSEFECNAWIESIKEAIEMTTDITGSDGDGDGDDKDDEKENTSVLKRIKSTVQKLAENNNNNTDSSEQSLTLAERIQPWTGASHSHCLNGIGSGGDHPLVISFHGEADIREYWHWKGMVVRMVDQEFKQQIAMEIFGGNDDNDNNEN